MGEGAGGAAGAGGPAAAAGRADGAAADIRLRPARRGDAGAVAVLVHATAAAMYERFAGDRESSIRALRAAFRRGGNSVSAEVVTVAEAGGAVAGAMAVFPAAEIDRRGRRFLRVLLLRTPPWTWRATARIYRLGAKVAPPPPPNALYVDSLATDPAHRRRGVARTLLAEAERRARAEGFPRVALETDLGNTAARALYESAGFEARDERRPRGGLPGFVAYVKRV